MPELPEVETVKEGLKALGIVGLEIGEIVFLRENLRNTFPVELPDRFLGAKINSVERRAKYILLKTDRGILISHLGMTGTWRKDFVWEQKKHDHILIPFDTFVLVYNDPRRFGFFDFILDEKSKNPYLMHLGPEPLSSEFNAEYLFSIAKKRNIPIKNLIMDQRIVVGVGNIYACEALYRASLRPSKRARLVTRKTIHTLVNHIKEILKEAIHSGGSTISDFKQAGGESGYFQHSFLVYGRESEACFNCQALIKNSVIGGRSSFYCPKCQS